MAILINLNWEFEISIFYFERWKSILLSDKVGILCFISSLFSSINSEEKLKYISVKNEINTFLFYFDCVVSFIYQDLQNNNNYISLEQPKWTEKARIGKNMDIILLFTICKPSLNLWQRKKMKMKNILMTFEIAK